MVGIIAREKYFCSLCRIEIGDYQFGTYDPHYRLHVKNMLEEMLKNR